MDRFDERIRSIDIEDAMRESYISYAMSVIIARALPDVRDGLKPVHRRVIYAMRTLGLASNRPYKKCAAIVGETMGKYHPHGDAAIYETLVRMAQDFSMRYLLVDGQGNYGSVDGDPPAAMRYTEARLTQLAEALLEDIDKETVDFGANFDESTEEPLVLPSAVPNLIVNGSQGIAVGMATNVPPHNLGETIDALVAMIDNPRIDLAGIMEHLPGPDFPTGGLICGRGGIQEAYTTGRGRIVVRAVAGLETHKSGRESIVVSEIPYTVNKARLIEEIAALVREKKIDGIADIRDESDREGMRIVIDLRRGEDHEIVLNNLFKHTRMQITYGIILLALVNNRPVYLSLAEMLQAFIDHREEVVVRRTRYELRKAEERAHILEGLRVALDAIDEVIALIRGARDVETAREGLMARFGLTRIQAQAILDMRLQRLTGLEREKIEEEYRELIKKIDHYNRVLKSPEMVMEIVKEELLAIKARYADERKTMLVGAAEDLDLEDLIAQENMVVTISHSGYIKRISTGAYRQQRRGGRGITAMSTKEEDFVDKLFIASTHDYLLFFTDKGRVYRLKVYQIPEGGRASKGKAIVNMLRLERGESVTAVLPVGQFDDEHFTMMVTLQGKVKKTALSAFGNIKNVGIRALTLEEGDRLLAAAVTGGGNEVILATRAGRAIRFKEDDVRAMGRTAAGVRGIRLREGDEVVGLVIAREGTTLLTICENGYGKRTPVEEYRLIGRGGQGVLDIKTAGRNGPVVAVMEVSDEDEIMLITQNGIAIRTPVKDISVINRNTQGVRLIRLDEGDRLVAAAKVEE